MEAIDKVMGRSHCGKAAMNEVANRKNSCELEFVVVRHRKGGKVWSRG